MSDTMNLNVRISGELKDFVKGELDRGLYENVSELVRDLIRKEKDSSEKANFEAVKAELQEAFSAPRSDFIELSADEVIARNKARLKVS